ncbi:ATP-dependent Clp protease proteolytic subunit [Microbacterium oryzae]|uniref:head maturation protease, ClpP-related n=1 Tax=Microbacterium oryzae TaxID=743009 RepID=UPI0025AF8BAF|nr:head maturation protease, ClpP-related [Microbacterium oryzae]MDN3309569.1 ATP-dependent Clp protease proteolytic subunit [Microbacterium oryzae]
MTANTPARDWFKIQARASDDAEAPASADVYIYDEIGDRWYGGGVGARSMAQQLDELDVDTIYLHLNSPGGAAWDGITIMNSLRRHRARVEVIVDGLAASAASVIAMAGDHIVMNRGSQMMIHDASGGAWGNAELMEETASILHKLSDSIADVYAARAGEDRAHWRALMRAESWYTAEEAVTAGLADEWADAPAAAAAGPVPTARFDPTVFSAVARANAPRVEIPELPVSTEPGTPNRKDEAVAYSDLQAGLRERLGVTDADASDETLLAALDETLAEQPDTTTTPTASTTLPEGTVAIDATVLAELQDNARQGAEARAEQDRTRRDGIVATALHEGRITAASRDAWRAHLDKDEEGASVLLASLAKNTAAPVAEIGHSDTVTSADDALYGAMYGSTEKEA